MSRGNDQPDCCEGCGVGLASIPGGWIEMWRTDGPRASTTLPVHTPERCQLLRRIRAMNEANA